MTKRKTERVRFPEWVEVAREAPKDPEQRVRLVLGGTAGLAFVRDRVTYERKWPFGVEVKQELEDVGDPVLINGMPPSIRAHAMIAQAATAAIRQHVLLYSPGAQ